MRNPAFYLITGLMLSACAFVRVSDAGADVAQASAPDVINCTELGEVQAQTQAKVLFQRGKGKVQQELIDLARNQAATLGANAIVAIGQPENGAQTFLAYRCD